DETIIELYWSRNEQAISETDIKYKAFLLAVANNIVSDRRDSEECLNDAYIGTWNSIPPARPILLKSFLAKIMRRVAINRFHANNRQKRIASEYAVSLSEFEDLITNSESTEAEFETQELAKAISNYVRSLSDRQMYIFISRYYIADPIPKISSELGCSVSTVKREITAIRIGLKNHLESEGYVL
ncbi:MAG: sigma-70 family RNA polymerase sigma factor, partial [Clostridia bacterium]|nr:sigma-70 family RNA polymerase sigma factor [Clostridia bacterium]